MEYIFGTSARDGVSVENLKTVGEQHTDLQGFCTTVRKFQDGSEATDRFRVLEHYHSAESGGKMYDWYIIDSHTRSIKGAPDPATRAAVRLAMMQAQALPDEVALGFVALYPEWIAGESYTVGQRVKYKGTLYKVLQGHVSQADWTPDAAPSLFAKVLPGQEGNEPEEGYAEWVQPDSTNGYSFGDRVMHNGKIWESTFDGANVWEPGVVGTEALWKDITDEVSSDDQGGVEE